jgi:hypothetical protein
MMKFVTSWAVLLSTLLIVLDVSAKSYSIRDDFNQVEQTLENVNSVSRWIWITVFFTRLKSQFQSFESNTNLENGISNTCT